MYGILTVAIGSCVSNSFHMRGIREAGEGRHRDAVVLPFAAEGDAEPAINMPLNLSEPLGSF